MKKYLLETHTFIWSIVDKNKLSEQVLKTLQDSNNQLFISAVSFWETENFNIANILQN